MNCSNKISFGRFLKDRDDLNALNWSSVEKIYLDLLDNHGYISSPIKFTSSFLMKLYHFKINYIAFKSLNQVKYAVILKNSNISLKNIK